MRKSKNLKDHSPFKVREIPKADALLITQVANGVIVEIQNGNNPPLKTETYVFEGIDQLEYFLKCRMSFGYTETNHVG
jgi:hypothetical protein